MKINITHHPRKGKKERWTREKAQYESDWVELPRKYKVSRVPIHLDIEVTNACNYKCEMCAFHSSDAKFPPKEICYMSFELFKKIIDENVPKGLRGVKLNFRGEPLMHPDIVKMVKYCKQHGIADCRFNTNGSLMTNELARELIKAGIDHVSFSIDDHRREVYNKIRIGGDFNKVYQGVVALSVWKQIFRTDKPYVLIQRIEFPETMDALDEYMEYWKGLCDGIATQELLDYNNITYDPQQSAYQCAFPWQRMVVFADGTIISCCGMPHGDKVLGNVTDISIEEAWNSPYMESVRKAHEHCETEKIRACAVCPMRNKLK